MEKKISSRGGGALLKKYGKDYFKKLAKKGALKRKRAMALWNKTHKAKS